MSTNRKLSIANELKALTVGHSKMIAWECVTRWSETVYEIGTYGKKQSDFNATLEALAR
jgi:hypothetical protein